MTNTNIQGPISLEGRGMIIRPNGNFQPGEFKYLINAELESGKIVGRRPIYSTKFTDVVDVDFLSYKGHLGNSAIYFNAQDGKQFALTPVWDGSTPNLVRTEMFDADETMIISDSGPYVTKPGLCYVFNYNNINYWLMCVSRVEDAGGTFFYMCSASEETGLTVAPEVVWGDGIAWFTNPVLSFNPSQVNDPATLVFKNAFMFRDRLWVVLSKGLYFSKATDPREFDVPDGGFFNFPDDRINYAVGLRDTVYVFCDTKVYSVTYNSDPNEDATVRVLSDQFGGTFATVHQDAVYFLNSQGISTITNGQYISKIVDAEDMGAANEGQLIGFGDYLIYNKGIFVFESFQDSEYAYPSRYNRYRDGYIDTTTDDNFYHSASTGCTDPILYYRGVGQHLGADDPVNFPNLTSEYVLRCSAKVTLNDLIAWTIDGKSGSDYNIRVTPGETLLTSVWLKTNCTDSCQVQFRIEFYDINDVQVDEAASFGTLINTDNWKQFKVTCTVGNSVAAGTAAYAKYYISIQNLTHAFTAAEYVYSQLYTCEPYKDDVPAVFAYGSEFYDNSNPIYLNFYDNNAFGRQSAIFRPLYAAGMRTYVSNAYDPTYDISGLGVQTYFINLQNGAVHAITPPNVSPNSFLKSILDVAVFNFVSPLLTGPILFMNFADSDADEWFPGFMMENRDFVTKDLFGYQDYIYTSDVSIATYRPDIFIEIENFVPDGNSYLMKKFRSLELQGKLPYQGGSPNDNVYLQFSLDHSSAYGTAISLYDDDSALANARPHYPRRIGINGRGRVLSLLFGIDTLLLGDDTDSLSAFEISDMRVLWQYLGRGPSTKQLT